MKKILFLMVIAAVTLVSCRSSNDDPQSQEDLVPIAPTVVSNLIAEASDQTRAGIAANAKASVVVWDLEKTTSSIADTDLSGNAPVTSEVTLANVTGTANTNLTLAPAQYYNANATFNAFLFGFYPAVGNEGVSLKTADSQKNVVEFATKDGSIDLCAAAMASANKNSTQQPTLDFKHKTCWITFKVKTDGSTVAANTKLTEIALTGAKVPGTMTLSKDGVSVAGVAPVSLNPAFSGTQALTGTAEEAKTNDLFIMPASDGSVKVSVKTELNSKETTYTDIALKKQNGVDDLVLEEGKHYVITLTFSQQEILPTVKVTDWVAEEGSASVR